MTVTLQRRAPDSDSTSAPVAAGRRLKLLIIAFSARNALEQVLDELAYALMPMTECRVLVPTNYRGTLPEAALVRVELGRGKLGGMLATISPLAHWRVLSQIGRFRPDVIHLLSGEGYPWAATVPALGGLLVPPEDPAAMVRALAGALRPGPPSPSFAELAPAYLDAYAAAGARVT